MTQIVKTEAIVLKSMKYGETSMIISLYTKQFGKISGIVKGARQSKSKFGSALQPMSYVSIVLYKKDSREIQTVTQCDTLKSFKHLSTDIEKMAIGMTMVELLRNVSHEEEENTRLFALIVDTLSAVNNATNSASNLLYHFELRLATLLGFQPRFDACISCRSPIEPDHHRGEMVTYHLGKGGPLCTSCAPAEGSVKKLSMGSLKTLNELSQCESFDEVLGIEIDDRTKEELSGFLWDYLRQHISGMRALKSQSVFAHILDAGK